MNYMDAMTVANCSYPEKLLSEAYPTMPCGASLKHRQNDSAWFVVGQMGTKIEVTICGEVILIFIEDIDGHFTTIWHSRGDDGRR